MAFAALDYYYNGLPIPPERTEDFPGSAGVPPDGHPLADYIYARLLSSFLMPSSMNFATWTLHADHSTWFFKGVHGWTREDEFPRICRAIDEGRPVPVGLVAARDLAAIGTNHQIVAFGYDIDGAADLLHLYCYDNNHRDIEVTLTVGPGRTPVRQSTGETWRGYFLEAYAPIRPTYTPAPPAAVPTGPAAHGDDMQPGEVLSPGLLLTSANGRYTFVYQGDGNLVLYRPGRALWASGTDGRPLGVCIMQDDGNLVVYGSAGQALWASGTDGNPGSRLAVQDDGNVVIYRPDNRPVWATNTSIPTGPTAQGADMDPGEVLNPDEWISSGQHTFVYQGDGNLVLYRAGRALWASGTAGRPAGVCIMQDDGNLVIYAPGGQPLWASNTSGNPGSRLVVQGDGNVVIYRPDNSPVWATNTWVPTGPTAQGADMDPGEVLNPDERISSGQYTFVYQGDGNLVLYRGGAPLWASGTDGTPVGDCVMQDDGNLVIYAPGGQPLWASNTDGNPGSHLVVQEDGNVVIYRPDNRPVWATNTVQS
jgi:hypothetical protein